MSLLSNALVGIKPSPTIAVSVRARELRAKGHDVIDLGAGEPDSDTPENIQEAAIKAIRSGKTRYTPVGGVIELKRAIVKKFKRENGIDYSESQVMVSAGGKQLIYNALMSTLNVGDEVLIPSPFWVSYPDITLLAGGSPSPVMTRVEDAFKVTPQVLEQALTEKSKWLILNSPSNPTGSAYTADELKALAEVLLRYPRVLIMSDDIYEHIVYDGFPFATLAQVEPRLQDRILTVNGVSKAYAMTGWRIGYGAGPEELIQAMTTLQSQSTSNPCSVAQWAAVEALEGPQGFIAESVTRFSARRDVVLSILSGAPGLFCRKPEGAFYVYPSCSACIGKTSAGGKFLSSDTDFVTALLEEQGVAVVQGEAFGASPYFRVSYATSNELLEEGCGRIVQFCSSLT